MKSVPTLYTAHCVLTSVTLKDLPKLRQVLDDADTQRFLPELCDLYKTEESLQQFIDAFDHYLQHEEGFLWGVRKDDVFIGFIAVMDIPASPTLFYALHPAYRHQGYTKESVSEVVTYCASLNLPITLQTEVYKDNEPSLSILKFCGFEIIGNIGDKVLLRILSSNTMQTHQKILHRIDYSQALDYNPSDPMCRFCYEVWEYDNYADDHFFHDVYMEEATAYKEVHRLKKKHDEEGGDRWDYWWILELAIRDHNKMMKEIDKSYKIIEVKE